jgi:cation:H+ antiporter
MSTYELATLILLPLGFYILVKGADWLVEGASSIAKRFKVSDLMIGLTIVALGTSLPELVVNVIASAEGATDLAIGNIIGSNISNILLILGICAIIYPISISKGTVWKEIPLNVMAVAVLFVLINDKLIDGDPSSLLSRVDGIILMFFFVIFMYYSFGIAKNRTLIDEISESKASSNEDVAMMTLKKSTLLIVVGMIALPIGSEIIIRGSLTLGGILGLSESFMGLTLLALGTSAPELATSAVAAYKKNADIAIGNIVGSNLFNIFWVLGLSALIRPLPPSANINIDIMVCGIATLLLFLFTFVSNSQERGWIFKIKREEHTLSRTEGILFVMMYVVYMGYLIWRG